MTKEDPLHKLSRTTTSAFRNQQYSAWKDAEKERVREIPKWGTPSKATPTKTCSSPLPRCATLAANPHKAYTPKKKPNDTLRFSPLSSNRKASMPTHSPRGNSSTQSTPTSKIARTPNSASRVPQMIKTPRPSTNKIDVSDQKQALELFDRLDENASGKLSLAELDKGIVEIYPNLNHKPAIMRAFHATDVSDNGFIERHEFPFFMSYMTYYSNTWNLFHSLDEDVDRRITKQEFLKVAKTLHLKQDPLQVFEDIDTNGGGMILFDEFCHWMVTNKIHHAQPNDLKKRFEELERRAVSSKETEKDIEPELIPEGIRKVKVPPPSEMMQIFDRLDENASGKLSLAELDKGIVMSYPELNHKPAIMAAYKAADKEDDGFVMRSEFEFFLRFVIYYNNLWQVFESVDTDDDRRISKDEFVNAAALFDPNRNAQEIFDEIDVNKGGMVLFNEMIAWFAKEKPEWSGAQENEIF
jgi:Ca2+-binding EF-hand superfamily protein